VCATAAGGGFITFDGPEGHDDSLASCGLVIRCAVRSEPARASDLVFDPAPQATAACDQSDKQNNKPPLVAPAENG